MPVQAVRRRTIRTLGRLGRHDQSRILCEVLNVLVVRIRRV